MVNIMFKYKPNISQVIFVKKCYLIFNRKIKLIKLSVSSRSSFSRGTLNVSSSSYTAVPRGNQNVTKNNPTRQPYLGWRSQEKVSQPRTPAERFVKKFFFFINFTWVWITCKNVTLIPFLIPRDYITNTYEKN